MVAKLFAVLSFWSVSILAGRPFSGVDDANIAFSVIDADNNGKISALELRYFLRSMGSPQTLWETRVLLDYGDSNGDGQFEEIEYRQLLKGFGI